MNWTPQRCGAKFCSTACGGGCTWAAYQQAQHDAKVLARSLGKDWKPRVSENLGWHFSAVHNSGCMTAYKNKGTGYVVYLGEPPGPGGRWVGRGNTPADAVSNAIQQAEGELSSLNALMDLIRKGRNAGTK